MKFCVSRQSAYIHSTDTPSEGRVLCTNFASSLLDIYCMMNNTGVAAHNFRNLPEGCLMKVVLGLPRVDLSVVLSSNNEDTADQINPNRSTFSI